jgi:hypothetical protein
VATERAFHHRHVLISLSLFLFATLLAGSEVGSTKKVPARRMGQVVDWSTRHMLYPQGASLRALALSERDPRAYWNYLRLVQAANAAESERRAFRPKRPIRPRRERPDWSVPLGAAGTAPDMFPAKFSFNVNAAPDCTNDFVVFTLNTAPSGTQANIAAFNNLYSGTVGGTGICGPGTATAYWAYQVSTVALPTSPILSLDGTKVAFVDGASPAVFHVLTWTANQGTVTAPATPTQIVNVTLTGATTDTLSPPFMDYMNDVAYVGSDNGRLFKITGVFKGTPMLAGLPWPRKAGTGILTAPVIDFSTGEIFVGSSDGNLYGFTKGGAEFFPLTIGSGGPDGGIVDGPVEDAVNGLLYVATGEDSTLTNAMLAQVSTASFAVMQMTPIGTPGVAQIHDGQFNDAYFSAPANMIGTTSEWFLYACGTNTGGPTSPVLYRAGFDVSRLMNPTVDAAKVSLSGNPGEQCSPLTEFKNGVDRLFLSLPTLQVVESLDISTSLTPVTAGGPLTEAGGTSGIIVDNVSAANQASSIYFSTLDPSANCRVAGVNQRCAIKLTQGALQ